MAILGVEAPGRQGVELVKLGPTPRDIMTPAAFENAIRVDMAMGGSTNTVLHIPAVARETGIDIDAEMNDRISRETPRRRYHRNRHSRSDAECSAGKGQSTDSPRRSRPNVS